MTKETVYPSQINTKTISCRISALDYVNFLNDALSKGITLNDWLLMKIYNQNASTNDLIGNIEASKGIVWPITIEVNEDTYTFNDIEDIESFIYNTNSKISSLLEWREIHKQKIAELSENIRLKTLLNIDLNDKEHRAVIFSKFIELIDQTEWENSSDKKEVKRNLRELYNDLFN